MRPINCGFRSLKGKASIANPETSFFLLVTSSTDLFVPGRTKQQEDKRSSVRVGTLRALRTQGKRLARNITTFPLPFSRLERERLACEQAPRGALAEGRDKEGDV